MQLTNAVLRAILAAIFEVDEKYVVPKQGTWFNPQDMLSVADGKPKTWVAFLIEGDRPIDVAHFQGDPASGAGNDSVQHRVASVALQFVGDRAHELALTVGHWIHRDTVRTQLAQVEGQLFGDVGDITGSDFYQDGENTVLAYNVRLRVAWTSRIPTGQGIMEDVEFVSGTLT